MSNNKNSVTVCVSVSETKECLYIVSPLYVGACPGSQK